jgi:NAD+ diphosphatase
MLFTEEVGYCPKCGTQNPEISERKLLHCGGCGFHYYLNTGSAVAGYVLNEAGEVLLIKRARDPGKGMLAPPGGFLDFGETGEAAVAREIKEETDLNVTIEGYLGSFPNQYTYRGITYPTLDLFFVCRAPSFDGAVALEEVESVIILPWQEVKRDSIAFESMRLAFDRLSDLKRGLR